MIPNTIFNTETVNQDISQEDSTYKLDLLNKRIYGKINDLEAVKQTAIKILATEKYCTPIYSDRYGVELVRLIGKDFDFVKSDIERTIKDALTVDDRILDITDFTMNQTSIDTLEVSFNINTIFGDIDIVSEVTI